MFVSTAYAQAAEAVAKPSMIESLLPMLAIFVIFYFLLIRPQTKKAKQHQEMLDQVKRGEEIITASGIVGKIDGMNDQFVTLEIANGVKIKMLKRQIASKLKEQQS
ncbi:MAG: preprotein translocase subunit YajC [Bdellovibrionota bacterium]|nr:preprotein translocase subunit YajC [Pseudobdellovibrionaceae bacterium]|tara:strand:- start:7059 stop:7376 length:318 start_codon:yes stop_codon:yes gene_type:complete